MKAEHWTRQVARSLRIAYRKWLLLRLAVRSGVLVSAAFAVWGFLAEQEAREEARRVAAWSLVAQSATTQANIGLNKALELLSSRDESLAGIDLQSAWLEEVYLSGADLRSAKLTRANLEGADLAGANLEGANLAGDSITPTNLRNTDFSGANLQGASLQESDLRDANFRYANLEDANLHFANVAGADFRDASGVDPQAILAARGWLLARHDLTVLKELGLPVDHNERVTASNLAGYGLSGLTLPSADLVDAVLADAVLSGARLIDADLAGADCTNADLSRASLFGADLTGASLRRASLQNADLSHATLDRANLLDADLDGCLLYKADLRKAANVSVGQVRKAKWWPLALYSDPLRAELGLAPNHNEAAVEASTDRTLRAMGRSRIPLDLRGVDLSGADLSGLRMDRMLIEGADIDGADLQGVYGTSCPALMSAENWELSYRDPHLACGSSIPTR